MTRKKVKLAYIRNAHMRKATFKKRLTGFMKKMDVLTTRCDIDACAIIYSPYDSQPEVWPSPLGVHRVLAQFKTMPEMEQSKKMVDQETFLRQRIDKAKEHLKKQIKENREMEMARVMFQTLTGTPFCLTVPDMTDLVWVINHHLQKLHLRIDNIKEGVVLKSQNQVPIATSDHDNNRDDSNMGMISGYKNHHHQQHMVFMGEDMMVPSADHDHSTMWPNHSHGGARV